MRGIYRDASNEGPHKDPPGFCSYRAFGEISNDLLQAAYKKDQDAAQAKAEIERKAKDAADSAQKAATIELPKAEKHDAALEKAVAAALVRDYPGNKVLKVILGSSSDDFEKDAFGRITGRDLDATVVNKHPDGKCELHGELWMQRGNGKSFSGPLSARGAGSLHQDEILCSRVEGTASADASSKKKKK